MVVMVKLGVILLVKLNSPYWRQRMTTGAFGLCAKRLMKLTPGEEEEEEKKKLLELLLNGDNEATDFLKVTSSTFFATTYSLILIF